MSLEENKAIVRKMIEAENKHNPALLDEFIDSDFVDEPNTPIELKGLDSYKKFEAAFIKGFPDFNEKIMDISAEEDKVWVWLSVTGTHTGEWDLFGIPLPPTGKKVTFSAVNVWRIADGKVVERKSLRDMLDFFHKLSLIELTEKGKKLFPEK